MIGFCKRYPHVCRRFQAEIVILITDEQGGSVCHDLGIGLTIGAIIKYIVIMARGAKPLGARTIDKDIVVGDIAGSSHVDSLIIAHRINDGIVVDPGIVDRMAAPSRD